MTTLLTSSRVSEIFAVPGVSLRRGLIGPCCAWSHHAILVGTGAHTDNYRWDPGGPHTAPHTVQLCECIAVHIQDTGWLSGDSCLSNMTRMLWLGLLTLMMPSRTFTMTLSLQSRELPSQPHAGPPEAERDFAEVFTSGHMGCDLRETARFIARLCNGVALFYLLELVLLLPRPKSSNVSSAKCQISSKASCAAH